MSLSSTLIKMIKDVVGEPTTGVEIGVYKGHNARKLLEAFPKLSLTMVDPWIEWNDKASYRKHKRTGAFNQKQWNEIYEEALSNTSQFQDKRIILRSVSEDASVTCENSMFDFVFIDGNHMYEMVKQDIDLWLPLTKKLISGHDYGGRYWGVRKAVKQTFLRSHPIMLPGDRIWGVDLK